MNSTEHRIPADLDAPASSRWITSRWMRDHPRRPDAVLAVSELVANAVVHGGADAEHSGILLRFGDTDGVTRVSVAHQGAPFTPLGTPDAGRGLALVEAAVDRWGVDRADGSVVVWFEVDRVDADTAALG